MLVVGVVGSYRKDGTIDRAVDAILDGAREAGADVSKIYLADRHIAFCTNCRQCAQTAGAERGTCPLADEADDVIAELEAADALVLGSPVNFGTVTAVMKTFMERLLCEVYWPTGKARFPRLRKRRGSKHAVVVASAAAPAPVIRWLTHTVRLLKLAARALGARTVGVLTIGGAGYQTTGGLSERLVRKAARLGQKLARPR